MNQTFVSQVPFWLRVISAFLLWLCGGQTVGAAGSIAPFWSYATGDALLSSPALGGNDTVYVGSYDEYLYAINTTNGQLRWRYSVKPAGNNEDAFIFSSPAVGADGTIYFGTDHQLNRNGRAVGEFYALNPNGTLKWIYPVSDAIYSDPAIGSDGTIYFGCMNTNLYALNTNGTLKWKFLAGEQIYSDPVVGVDGGIYFGCDNGRLYAVNTNGTLRWSFDTGHVIAGSPAIGAGGVIYVGSLSSNLFSISPAGATNWAFPTGDRVASSPTIGIDGTIYVGCDSGRLFAVNPDGTQKWSVLLASGVQSSPALAQDGTIYIGTDDGDFLALDANGLPLWSTNLNGYIYSSPVIGRDGTVFVGSSDFSLYALAGVAGLGSGPWPMFRHDALHTASVTPPPASNTPPTLAGPGDRTIHAGTPSVLVAFTVADAQTPASSLIVTGLSSNPLLVSMAGLVFGGSASNRTLSILPAEGQLGATTITLAVTDIGAAPLTTSACFVLNVVPAPRIDPAITGGTDLLLSWNAIVGAIYRIQRKLSLDDPFWEDLPGDVTATSTNGSRQEATGDSGRRFYRIIVLSQP